MKHVARGFFRLVVALLLVAGALYIGREAAPGIKLGLDLAGGVSITYKTVSDNPNQEQMSDTIYKLQLKSQDYSTEAEVYQEGNDRINIDIPGVSDATKILTDLGEPGSLNFVEGELSFPVATRSYILRDRISTISVATNVKREILRNGVSAEDFEAFEKNEELPVGTLWTGSHHLGDDGVYYSGESNDSENSFPLQEIVQYDYTAKPSYEPSQVVVTGDDISSAEGGIVQDSYGQTGYVVSLVFNESGASKFSDATVRNLNRVIYILFNGDIVSAPTVQAQITDGRAQITGMSSLEEANRLASTIRIGALPVQLEELRSNVVGAKLGTEAIQTSLKAGVIGLGIVILFMLIIYLIPGLAASLALAMYTGLMLFLVQSFEMTLTLPGIAGILLSIGMAVDANVIIFTRIKEEIGNGHSTQVAIKEGYNKALSAILDGNITTLIAALVLFLKGSGTVKGFATTLALGIVLSLVTSLFVTRFIMNAFYDLGLRSEKLYGKKVDDKIFPFINIRKVTYTVSVVTILVGLVFIGMHTAKGDGPFNYGLDFKGGSSTTVTFNENLSLDDIDRRVVPIFEDVTKSRDTQTQKVSGSNEVIIKTRTLTIEERDQIYEKLASTEDEGGFEVDQTLITTENISGAISDQMKSDALTAVIFATILMLLYIWIRFKDIRFAGSAVTALVHDCLVTIGFYGVVRETVDSTFIACMLTLVGYSINATIIIFDRIRENLNKYGTSDLAEVVNRSITETFTRSINTTITTLIMVIVLYIIGVSSIKTFALPLMVGIVAGAWSSILITGSLWYDMKRVQKLKLENSKKNEIKSRMGKKKNK